MPTDKMSQKSEYAIAPIQKGDVKSVMELLRRTFYVDEPMNKAIALYESGTCEELDEYCTYALLEGLSFKAIDNEGNIIGVMISGVCPLKEDDNGNDLFNQALRCKNPKFQKILHVLARREEGARLWERFPDEEHLVEVKVSATDQRWRKRGIMNALLAETEKATKQRNIRMIRMDTSSAYSAMSAERLGFTCVYKARYTDLKLDGRPLIVPEAPHFEDKVYIKILFDRS